MTLLSDLAVLVAEDHPFQRRMIACILNSMGAREVLQATDGKQALTLIQGGALIDLVVCDLDMPEMDGMELIRHLGEANSKVAVIISSAKEYSLLTSVEKMARAYNIQLLGVIKKPMTSEQLNDLIVRYVPPNKQPQQITSTAAPSFSLEQILHGIQQKQFELFFQPQVELLTGRILGAEALARWRHPQQGLIDPYAFIPALEKSGDIDKLTLLLLENAAITCSNWRKRGLKVTVSVNLSLVSLVDTRLSKQITQIVHSTGLNPRYMILEITETASMTEVAPALENLARLRMRGFGLAIDDYGTGFSSLRQLIRVPFTELKIDQSFVTGCAKDPSSRAIVESSVEMARRLNIRSVAEGVETQADRDILVAANCDIVQGYFIAKPMDEYSFLRFCAVDTGLKLTIHS